VAPTTAAPSTPPPGSPGSPSPFPLSSPSPTPERSPFEVVSRPSEGGGLGDGDDVDQLVQLVVGGAVLLGLAGAVGLYLTRDTETSEP
jgi:hypothetical protein